MEKMSRNTKKEHPVSCNFVTVNLKRRKTQLNIKVLNHNNVTIFYINLLNYLKLKTTNRAKC